LEVCSRRPVVLPVDARVDAFVSAMVLGLHTPAARGIYQLKLDLPFWSTKSADQLKVFQEELRWTIPDDHAGEQCNVAEMPPTQIAALLNKPGRAPMLTKNAVEASPGTVKSMRDGFESESRIAYLKELLSAAVSWGAALVALVALVYAVHMFYSRLYATTPGRQTLSLLGPMMVQVLIGGAGIGVGVTMVIDSSLWPGIFLVPAVGVILLCECWSWLRANLMARRNARVMDPAPQH